MQFGLPACTWPFCLSALTFLLLTTGTNKIFKLPLAKVTYPEKNLTFYWKMKKNEKAEKAKAVRKEQEEQLKAIERDLILNEKEKIRLEIERMEEGRVEGQVESSCTEQRGPEQVSDEERSEEDKVTEEMQADSL